jgi:DNA end-binding protein Ku
VLSYRLVSIPVKIYPAVREWRPKSRFLHAKCGKRPERSSWCTSCEEKVLSGDIVRGHEVAREDFLRFTNEEYKALQDPERSGDINVRELVSPTEIEPRYLNKHYWVVPTGAVADGYVLLRDGLRAQQKVAIAKAKLKTRAYVTVLRPDKHLLAMVTMRYSDEVIDPDFFPEPKTSPNVQRNKELSLQVLSQFATTFDPTRHPNEYRARIQAAIDRKFEEVAARNGASAPHSAEVFDMSGLLAQSITEAPKPKPGLKKATTKPSKPRKVKKEAER